MVIAAALEWSPLSRSKRLDVVQRSEAALLTPRGLRSLDPEDPAYLGRYGGDVVKRIVVQVLEDRDRLQASFIRGAAPP